MMDEHDNERALDVFDQATQVEELHRNQALAAHRARQAPREAPDEDDEGNRYCLDCGDEIPRNRILAAPHAVRCVKCESRRENRDAISRGRGGFQEE